MLGLYHRDREEQEWHFVLYMQEAIPSPLLQGIFSMMPGMSAITKRAPALAFGRYPGSAPQAVKVVGDLGLSGRNDGKQGRFACVGESPPYPTSASSFSSRIFHSSFPGSPAERRVWLVEAT